MAGGLTPPWSRLHHPAARPVADRRLPLAGILVGPYTPGFVADTGAGRAARRDRRHPADVRRRPAVPHRGAARGRGVAIRAPSRRASSRPPSARCRARVRLGLAGRPIVFGMALSVASTVVLIRVLADNRDLHTPPGTSRSAGWSSRTSSPSSCWSCCRRCSATAAAQAPLWRRARPDRAEGRRAGRLHRCRRRARHPVAARHVAATRSRELFTLTVLVLALGIAVGSALVFGVSMALGAFLAGMVVGRRSTACGRHPKRCRCATPSPCCSSCRWACCSIRRPCSRRRCWSRRRSPSCCRQAAGRAGRRLCCCAIRSGPRSTVAVALAQIGEFSFILAALGPDSACSAGGHEHVVAVSIVSIVLNPLLYRAIAPFERWVVGTAARSVQAAERPPTPPRPTPATASLPAAPRTGRWSSATARPGARHPAAARQRHRADHHRAQHGHGARAARAGIDAVYGDATHPTRSTPPASPCGSLI